MSDAVYEAVKRRSEAYLRDRDCREWYMPDGTHNTTFRRATGTASRPRPTLSAIIEGLFGITPTQFGFDEINIWPPSPELGGQTGDDRRDTAGQRLPEVHLPVQQGSADREADH